MTDPEQTGAPWTGPLDAAGDEAPTSTPASESSTHQRTPWHAPHPDTGEHHQLDDADELSADEAAPSDPGAVYTDAVHTDANDARADAAGHIEPSIANAPTTPQADRRARAISLEEGQARLEDVLREVRKVIVGQDHMVERMVVALLARGHCLLEGVPGVAKTLAVQTLATVVGGTFKRIQFTRDMVVSDIVGGRILVQLGEILTELGPVFANFVLADEINRGPTKVQSALLEVMAERQISIGGTSHRLPLPFVVMATQNPIESEGVYPLPEAQRDRFLMRVIVPYPTPGEERRIVRRMGVRPPVPRQVLDTEILRQLQEQADDVFLHDHISDYAVRLVLATRDPAAHGMPELTEALEYGASPRGTLGLISAARALALVRGRDYVVPDDVASVAPDVLPHRLVLSYKALADGLSADHVVTRILEMTQPPRITPVRAAPVAPRPPLPVPAEEYADDASGHWHPDESGFPEYEDENRR
jgi:MoxR-like ATPase